MAASVFGLLEPTLASRAARKRTERSLLVGLSQQPMLCTGPDHFTPHFTKQSSNLLLSSARSRFFPMKTILHCLEMQAYPLEDPRRS